MNSQKIAILTDSCADLRPEYLADHPIYVVPLKILCADGEYDDGVTIHARDVYARLKAGELPKTSLPDGAAVDAVLDQIRADGYEKVAAIMLSSGLSGTYNMVRLLVGGRKDLQIKAFDSLSGALGEGCVALQAALDIENGMSWEELTEERIPRLLANVHPYFSVDTLEYLMKGGRIGKITALAGSLLNIKPILGFAEDGQLQSVAKVRGRKALSDKFLEIIAAEIGEHQRYDLLVANGGAPEEMAALRARMEERFPHFEHFWESELDATLSTYIGDGVLGAGVLLLD